MQKLFVFLVATIISFTMAFGEENTPTVSEISGIWLGKMKVADKMELTLGFVITQNENGELSATMNVIEQKAYDIQMDIVSFKDDSLRIELSEAGIAYTGTFDSDTKFIYGKYIQGEAKLELNLHEVNEFPGEVVRPQTPVAPFPYLVEEVVFENTEADIKLAGTLTKPTSNSVSPAIILVAGSGHTDRNETKMGHFLLLADYFTRNGYVVLRYDKRGVGESSGNYDSATSFDFAEDVTSGIEFLKKRKDVDPTRIGIIGHSEGALLAPIVASQKKDIAFIVLMGGIGVPCDELMLKQTEKIAQINGVPENEIANLCKEYKEYYTILKSDENEDLKRQKVKESNVEISDGLLGMLLSPWFQSFIQINPTIYLEKVDCPVLAITGQYDVQCSAIENLSGIEQALERGGNKNYITKTLPNLNHLFQTSISGSPTEYESIAEIIAPSVLELLGNWVDEKVDY